MIFPLTGLAIGALLGVLRARSKGGKALDLLQWGAVGAIICGLIGLFVLIYIERSYIVT